MFNDINQLRAFSQSEIITARWLLETTQRRLSELVLIQDALNRNGFTWKDPGSARVGRLYALEGKSGLSVARWTGSNWCFFIGTVPLHVKRIAYLGKATGALA